MMALAIGSAVALLYSAYLFVFNPLSRLQTGLARVGGGDLAARVEVDSSDEFGELSAGFNQMAQTLQGLYQNLEERVREKTLGLETERARLAALYEAAAFVASPPTWTRWPRALRSRCGAWRAPTPRRCAGLTNPTSATCCWASDCLPQHVADAERCITTGECFCGQARDQARRASSPSAPCRRRAHARPLRTSGLRNRDQRAGAPARTADGRDQPLLPQRRHVLKDEDRALLETLASHLAAAIEGLRAGALEREAAVAEERSLLARELHDSIAQSLSFLKIQAGLLRDAVRRQDAGQVDRTCRAGCRCARKPGRRARAAAALPHAHQRRGHHAGAAHHADQVRTPDRPGHAPAGARRRHAAGRRRAGAGAARGAGGAVQRAQARAGQTVWVEVLQGAEWRVEVRDDGCGFEAPAHRRRNPRGPAHHARKGRPHRRIGGGGSVPGSGTCVVR
jgi:two-component system nitrate/nitrite sensor histidine kinase NarX